MRVRTRAARVIASGLAAVVVAIAGVGCGDDGDGAGGSGGSGGSVSSSGSTSTPTSAGPGPGGGGSSGDGGGGTTGDGGGGSGTGGAGGAGGEGGDGGGGGPGGGACTATAPIATRGSAVATSPDDGTVVVVNRDAGTVTVLAVADDGGLPAMTVRAELAVGGEPWQVAIDACGERAYVVLRREQRVVVIEDLTGRPAIGGSVAVGSEPTGLALSPNGTRLFVANWVDGTVSVIEPARLALVETIDLNATLAGTGLLGDGVAPRPALAHPRSLAVTNDGDADDADETVVVTEFFAQRTEPEETDAVNADTNWIGLLYTRGVTGGEVDTVPLGALADTGFADGNGAQTGCWPNQLQSVTLRGTVAYVLSICASPRGPVGGANVKTMTHPVLSAVDVAAGAELDASPVNLAERFDTFYDDAGFADDSSRRVPLVANDLAFEPETGDAWITANGVDAVFRAELDDGDGDVVAVGAGADRPFVDLGDEGLDAAARGSGPIGIATAHGAPSAFVASDITRNLAAVDLADGAPEVAGLTSGDPRVVATAALPVDPGDLAALRGKQAFNTGLGRMSQNGQGWGACQSCHFEGLSDNVTWYFARGPRQSTSLDGSFASGDPSDRRVFNWTAVFDEFADFENVARGLDGGVGALVHTANEHPTNADRLDLNDAVLSPPAGANGLNGSARQLMEDESALQTWADVEVWVQRLRSPRAPTGLDGDRVEAGAALFAGEGGCVGCHGGAKWTLSQVFYEPGGAVNEALKITAWDGDALAAQGFPVALFPATEGNRVMRSAAGGDQIQCVLRPVGTYAVSPPDVGVVELRADLSAAQGAHPDGNGYNVPSLLGASVGAPFFHAGNARTLEELLTDVFATHRAALADDGFMSGVDEAADRDALVAFLLSIDESTTPIPLPDVGSEGGSFCAPPP